MAAAQPLPEAPARNYTLWICLFLALSTLVIYWPVTRHEFVSYDDNDYVTQNPYVQAGLRAKSLAWVWRSEVARNWHPVTMLSHMLDCQLYGMNAGRHHLTNLLFHIANTLLLFLLLRKMTGALWRSGVVAALFALHPLHVESVAWIAERKDVLSTFFFLLTIWAYVRCVQRTGVSGLNSESRKPKAERNPKPEIRTVAAVGSLHSALWYALALLFFAIGLMSKPMLVTLPCLLLLLDYWPLQRLGFLIQGSTFKVQRSKRWQLLKEKLPFFALSAASCVITFLVQQKGGAVLSTIHLPIGPRVANALMSYVRYLGKTVCPDHLAALYLRNQPWPAWQVALAAVLLMAVSVAVIRLARRHAYLAAGWFWYLGTLVPVIGLVQVGMQSMADRYTYIPLIGIFIVAAWGGWELAGMWRLPKIAVGLATALILAACMVLTRAQLAYWKDGETLLQRMVTATEGNYMAHYNLGNLYDRQGKTAEAIQHYEAALTFQPNYADAHNNLATVLLRQRRFDEAIAHSVAAARLNPGCLFQLNLGNALADAGRFAEAVAAFKQALQFDPNSSLAHHNLALVFQTQENAPAAMAEFRAALQLQPDYESAEHNLANLLAEAGRLEEAINCYLVAERLNPNHAESYNGLGICYAMQGELPEAERQLREAIRLNPEYAGAESNLGNALGAQNKLAESIPHYQKALQLNPKDFQTHFNLAVSLIRTKPDSRGQSSPDGSLAPPPRLP